MFFFRELTWQWRWDGYSFSWVIGFTLRTHLICVSCSSAMLNQQSRVVAEASCQKTLQNSSREWACAFDGGLGPPLRSPVIPGFCEHLHPVPRSSSVSAGEWGKCPERLGHHQRNLTRVVKAHNGNKPKGTLERESWRWKSPMSKSSYGGADW